MRIIRFRALEGKYEIGSDGTVWSLDYNHTSKRKQLRTYLDRDGYPYVFLNNYGKRTKTMVHRMVAENFLEKPINKNQVNHKNGVRNDNQLENLEWVTPQENAIHGWRCNGRKVSDKQRLTMSKNSKGELNPKAKMTYKKAIELRGLRENGASLKELSKIFDISVSQVCAIAQGRFWNEKV